MSIFEYDKEEEERKLRKAEYESGVADGFNDGINTAKKIPLLLLQNFICRLNKLPLH